MLKNVAIPLMLAASEAEAQRGPSRDEVLEALAGDRAEEFAGLVADAAACTVASSEAADGISNLAQALGLKETALKTKQGELDALTAADGAWTTAEATRVAAVQAAVAKEAEAGIAALLDTVDEKSELERAAAEAYATADKLYQVGIDTQTAANAAAGVADARLLELLGLKDAAVQAVAAVRAEVAKEMLWREWRYCELGAAVAGETLPDAAGSSTPATTWWGGITTDTVLSAAAQAAATAPVSCTVPAVAAATAGDPDARAAVTYYTTKTVADGGLAAESGDGTAKWTATLVHTSALTAESATSTYQGATRSKRGEIAWLTGSLRAKTWTKMQREREQLYYKSVADARGLAETVATEMARTDDSSNSLYVVPADPGSTASSAQQSAYNSAIGLGLTSGTAGAASALATAATARDAATAGGKAMPGARTQVTTAGEEWKWTWAITAASMDAWTAANSSAGASSSFWALARDVNIAVDAWHADALTALVATADTSIKAETATSALLPCDQSSPAAAGGVSWGANAATTENACKLACQAQSTAALTETVDSIAVPRYSAAASTAYCGAYSFESTSAANAAVTVCKLLTGSNSSVQAHTATGSEAGKCFTMTNAAAIATLQGAIQTKYALLVAGLYTAMESEAETQAALESAWLEAWYEQQYWSKLALPDNGGSLSDGTVGSKGATYLAKKTELEDNSSAALATSLGVAGSEAARASAESALNTAVAALAVLEAATAAAAAPVAALGARIIRAGEQLVTLNALANADGTSGTLDEAAAARTADWEEYGSAGGGAVGSTTENKGIQVLATEAKAAADLAVREASTGVTAGALTANRASAQADWTAATAAATAARTALTDALSAADELETLRAAVARDTGLWDTQEAARAAAAAAIVVAQGELEAAQDALDEAVLNCQLAAYDDYRAELEAKMVQRAADLVTIKALLETELKQPAPGTAGARCEKALSNGTYRPARGELTCAEGLCCGAARVWMESGTTADAGWRTIETCQDLTATSYLYQPARAPMATTMPTKVSTPFTCIEGAKALAAAASAVAAAVYMLA